VVPFELVITELMEGQTNSFIEVQNLGLKTVFMTDWTVGGDQTSGVGGESDQPKIAPGARGVILEEGSDLLASLDAKTGHLVVPSGTLVNVLQFGAASAVLYDDDGYLIATALTPPQPPAGMSVEILDPYLGDRAGNWGLSGCSGGHSAGANRCESDWEDAPLVLRELHLNPGDENRGRFVEVLNVGSYPVSGNGWALLNERFIRQFTSTSGADFIFPGGRGLFGEVDAIGPLPEPGSGSQLLAVANDDVYGMPFKFEEGIGLLHPGGGRIVDGVGGVEITENNQSLQHVAAPSTHPGEFWATHACNGGSTPWAPHCEEQSPYGQVDVVEVQLDGVQENEAFIEVVNREGLPVGLSDRVVVSQDGTLSLSPGSGNGMVLEPFGRGIITNPLFGESAGDSVILEEDFEDGAVGVENWTALLVGDTNNALFEHAGSLVGALSSTGAVGIVSKEKIPFASRGIWVETEMVLPFGPGGEVRGLVHLGDSKSGTPSEMGQFLQLRFSSDGINHNLSLHSRNSGESPQTLWSWQEAAFCCPSQTQQLRVFMDGSIMQFYYGPSDDDLLVEVTHGVSPQSFAESHLFVGWEVPSGISDDYEASASHVVAWRPAFDYSEEALQLHVDAAISIDSWAWSNGISWDAGPGKQFPGTGAPWLGSSMIKSNGSWEAAECGPTPGYQNCDEEVLYPGVWWDERQPDNTKSWKRVIGVPEAPENCESLHVCSRGLDVLMPNVPAHSSFSFTNSFSNQTIRFSERSSAHDGCEEGCTGNTHVVSAGATEVIPSSSGGFYFVETVEGVKAADVNILGGGFPPPEGLLPNFATGGAP